MGLFKLPTLDNVLMGKIKSLLNRLEITSIDTIQAYNIKGSEKVMLNYYFSKGWDSGIQLIFHVIDGKLKFQKYGKFGWRNEIYNTVHNQKVLDDFILEIENHFI